MFRTIVAGTDGSQRADVALKEAIDLASSQGARLHLVAAFSKRESHWEDLQSTASVASVNLGQVAEQVLAREAKKAEEQGVEVDWEAHEGDPAEVIIEAAIAVDADLIVVGNRGMSGTLRFMLGSVPNKVTHHAPCSVLVVHTD